MLTNNQKRLHYLIYLYTHNNRDSWIRQEVLFALIYFFIKNGVFDEPYDYSPSPYMWDDKPIYINISYEAMNDLDYLLDNEYIYEILLSTRGLNIPVKGYRIAKLVEYDFPNKEEIDKVLIEDGKVKPVELTDNGIVIKSKKGDDLRIDITKLGTVPYKSKSYILGVSL
ncbi:hypothetical protein [Methanotorris igneus]|uniref:Antitoxin SocA-like Panacea domain-containing protein n=1 Tax=Methanotorris igneus (strain DSM 5666 / JCM 11834 / Kol 5) TaxID=880724 RepID=F6BBB4_METIK|nr:hypothetical protein [Methanotorris igneus]AEF97121.1 hypothetical protein Metig_1588 [Methanotorris igneus Kol 5]